MKRLKYLIFVFLFSLVLQNCGGAKFELVTLRIKGSDTMLRLTELLAEEYMKENTGASIYVEGGGTASGIKALGRGESDICTASRTLKSDEIKILANSFGSLGVSFLIAKDALSIYLNSANGVTNLSTEDLSKIFRCEVTNWKDLGGIDDPIMLISRSPNSGTYLYFKEHILDGKEYCENKTVLPTTEKVIAAVEENHNAIGYGGIGYQDGVALASVNGIAATAENVRNDKYPIVRYLYFYTPQSPKGAVKDFIDWVLSPDGQKVINRSGYVSLWDISS